MSLLALADEESLSYHLGQGVAVLLFSIPAVACFQKALRSPPGSLRYSYLSALMGLLLLVQIEIPLDFRNTRPGILLLVGMARGLLATAGLIFAVRALTMRRADKGVGWLAPCAGILLCGIHGLYGISLITIRPLLRSGVEGESWVYRSEADNYSITLPSKQWAQARMENASSVFKCRVLPVHVAVIVRGEPREAYVEAVKSFKANSLPTLRDGRSEEGKTPAGQEFFTAQGYEKQPTKDVLVTVYLIYRPEWGQTVTLLSEATPNLASQTGQAAQLSAIQEAVRSICLSLK